ncbi:hypothetical protein J1N35_000905, partial [Gossypium stocksii]
PIYKIDFQLKHQIERAFVKIRRKVSTSSQRRISSFKYRYLMSMNLVRYDTFELKGDIDVKLRLDTHCSTRNVILG